MRAAIHTSDRQSFKRCRQRWEFSSPLRMNLEPLTPITPLWFGTNVHEALADYYHPDSPRDGTHAVATFLQKTYEHLAQFEDPDPETVKWVDENAKLGAGMLEHYFGTYAPIHDPLDFSTVVSVEKHYEIPIPGVPGISYSFRLDGMVLDKYGRYWILEHKTTAQFIEDTQYLLNDDQVGSYIWGVREAEGIQVEGVIYNSLKKKAPMDLRPLKAGGFSIAKNQDTTFEIAVAQLRDYYGKIPRHYWEFLDMLKEKPNNFVQRELVRRNPRELDILGESLRVEVLDMLSSPHIYRSPSRINCNGCPFLAPCISKWEGSDYSHMLGTLYRRREHEW